MKDNQKRKEPRPYRRDYGHPTPTTVSPELRKRENELIDAGKLSEPEIFRRLGFDRIGMSFNSFRGYAYWRRRKARRNIGVGRITGSTERAEATPELILLKSYRTVLVQLVDNMIDNMIDQMIELRRVADLENPK